MLYRCLVLLFLTLITATAGHSAIVVRLQDASAPTFQNDILPLLQAKCSRCHSDKVHKAELDLTTLAGILKGGESGNIG